MCVIIASKGNATPDREELWTGCTANPDGFGWSVLVDDGKARRLITHRTMEAREAIEDYLATVDTHGETVVASIFHARITTHGASSVENCHPWQVGNDPHSVLFHNGILSVDMARAAGRSDTGVFAGDVLPKMGGAWSFQNPDIRPILEDWSTGSKLVMLTARHDLEPLSFIGENRGTWQGESWYSNSSCWLVSRSWTAPPASTWQDNWSHEDIALYEDELGPVLFMDGERMLCGECLEPASEGAEECELCGVCFDCGLWDCACTSEALERS